MYTVEVREQPLVSGFLCHRVWAQDLRVPVHTPAPLVCKLLEIPGSPPPVPLGAAALQMLTAASGSKDSSSGPHGGT